MYDFYIFLLAYFSDIMIIVDNEKRKDGRKFMKDFFDNYHQKEVIA